MNKNCPECGKPLKEGYTFCGKCGAKIVAPEPLKKEPETMVEKKVTMKEQREKKAEKKVKEPKKPNEKLKEFQISDEKIPKTVTKEPEEMLESKSIFGKKGLVIIAVIIIAVISILIISSNSNDPPVFETIKIDDNSNDLKVVVDSDGDGYLDWDDAFPNDPFEWKDSDNDGYGDNSDAFPYDSSEHLDSDKDGVGDNKDVFPNNPDETKDSDNDGLGDNADIDDDNDGYSDDKDFYPYQDAKIKVTISRFKVIDVVDLTGSETAEVYRKIITEDGNSVRWPGKGNEWDVAIGELKTVNREYTYNVPDDQLTHEIVIQLFDSDQGWGDDQLDIDGTDNTKGLSIYYNIVTGKWTGDDTDGISDGSYDGSLTSDDDDAYLEYDIETI